MAYDICPNITDEKRAARNNLFPVKNSKKLCSLAIVSNTAEPRWVNVNCDRKYLSSVLCTKNKNLNNFGSFGNKTNVCEPRQLKVHKNCFSFLWINSVQRKSFSMPRVTVSQVKSFFPVFDAVKGNFPPVLCNISQIIDIALTVRYRRLYTLVHFAIKEVKLSEAKGYVLLGSNIQPIGSFQTGSNMFTCLDGSIISVTFTHDGKRDCVESEDENVSVTKVDKFFITPTQMSSRSKNCCPYLYSKVLKTGSNKEAIQQVKFECKDGDTITSEFTDDLIPDCAAGGDEPQLLSLLYNKTRVPCLVSGQIACLEGHSKCHDVSDICLFKLDIKLCLEPCRNGGHLQECALFECNAHFKCPESFCIPWTYLCDGKWDCAFGDDETDRCISSICHQTFKCKDAGVCAHETNICDGYRDCPLGDDEMLCEMHQHVCPLDCHCLSLGINCENISYSPLYAEKLSKFRFVSLSGLNLPENSAPLQTMFSSSQFLILISCGLTDVCSHFLPKNTLFANMSKNNQAALQQFCFVGLPFLTTLDLSSNRIWAVQSLSFVDLSSLIYMFLHNNPLHTLDSFMFAATENIHILDISKTSSQNINFETFYGLQANLLISPGEDVCCAAEQTEACFVLHKMNCCCSLLIPNNNILSLFLTSFLSAVILNLVSVFCHKYFQQHRSAYTLIVILMNISHLCSVIHLIFLLISHVNMGKDFLLQIRSWKSDIPCFAGFYNLTLQMFLIESLYLAMAMSKCSMVIKPIESRLKARQYVKNFLLAVFTVTNSGVLFLVLHIKYKYTYLPVLCNPVPSKDNPVLNIIVVFMTVVQFSGFIVCSVLHIPLVKNLTKTREQLGMASTTRKTSLTSFTVQFVLVCSFQVFGPTCATAAHLIHILSNYTQHTVVYILVGGILPLFTLLNPSLFLVLMLKKIVRTKLKAPKIEVKGQIN